MPNFKSTIRYLCIIIILYSSDIFAQANLITENISIKDGLSSNIVRDIVQDKYGYLWIATADGLNRYDGYNVEIFKNIPDDTTSIPANNLFRLFADSHGTLWISTDNGLSRYNRQSNNFTTYRYSQSNLQQANRTICIYEDSRDNLWVSTLDGTLLFDRKTKKFLRYDVMQTDNSVSRFVNYGGMLIEGKNGGLYCVSQSFGLLKFDYDAGLFVQIALKNNWNERIRRQIYYDLVVDDNNNLWIALTDGVYVVNLDSKEGRDVTPYNRSNVRSSTDENSTTGLYIDRNKNIWIGTMTKGMYLYDNKKQIFENIIPESSIGFFGAFCEDNSGILWYGSSRGIYKYDFDKKPFVTYTMSENDASFNRAVLSFAGSSVYKDLIWLGSTQGVYYFDKKTSQIKKGSEKNSKLSQLDHREITAIEEAKDGSLWLATIPEGLYKLDIKSGVLKNFKHTIYNLKTLYDDRIQSLAMDKNENVWVGTQLGLNLLKKNSTEFTLVPSFLNRVYHENLLKQIQKLRQEAHPVSSIIKVGDYADLTKEFVLRKDARVIIYSMGEGLMPWNMVDYGWLENEQGDTLWNAADFFKSYHASGAPKNRLKIGLMNLKAGRYKLRYKSDDSHSFESFNQLPPQDSTYWGTQIFALDNNAYSSAKEWLKNSDKMTYLSGESIEVIFCDSKNNIWIGTNDGISKIDSLLFIKNYTSDLNDKNSLSNNSVRDINEDLFGNIWIATADGLNKFNPVTQKFTVFREKEGLPSSNLSAIEVDENGHLWVSGLKGISKVELDEKGDIQVVVNYDVKDGLQGYEFTHNASFRDTNGKLYFSGNDGFNAFYPGSSNRTPPFIAIQQIKISNKPITSLDNFQTADVNLISDISLSYDQNDLSFEFASIHFSRPDKNRLLYKLDGVDNDWRNGDRRFASYTNLSPGDYVFNLRGSNGDGIWSKETRKINIHIAAPWYNNWAAYFVYVILFAGLLLGIRKIEMGRQQKNVRIRESQLRAETAELKAQAAEAQAKVVQAENERKTKELEEARSLQLSMLPKELPQLPHLDIAVYMQTATEVGGDYYDFYVGLDGTLTVVVGDATGHGMKAGTMVTAAKSLFNSYAPNPDILFSFREITRCIKQMNFGKLSMCMTMIKIKGNKLHMSSAGMPPSFIFRRDTQVIEEHLFKAMPLGTMDKFPYEMKDTTLNPGDTILLMSDGLPELANKNGELYGYKKIRNGFEDVAEKSPEQIINYLKNEGASWVNNEDPNDDVTFVVIKVK